MLDKILTFLQAGPFLIESLHATYLMARASVAQWLCLWLLVQRVRGSIAGRPAHAEINSGLYIRHCWFIGIELVLGPTT